MTLRSSPAWLVLAAVLLAPAEGGAQNRTVVETAARLAAEIATTVARLVRSASSEGPAGTPDLEREANVRRELNEAITAIGDAARKGQDGRRES